jgi:hypothetical protein
MMAGLVLLSTLLPFNCQLLAQDQNQLQGKQKIVFHVTSVRSEDATDWCQTGECSATRFTLEGHANVNHDGHLTQYVLKCVEVMAVNPSPHNTVVCGRVHANNDYDAFLFADSIFFADNKPKSSGAPFESGYSIVSEKEVTTPRK